MYKVKAGRERERGGRERGRGSGGGGDWYGVKVGISSSFFCVWLCYCLHSVYFGRVY